MRSEYAVQMISSLYHTKYGGASSAAHIQLPMNMPVTASTPAQSQTQQPRRARRFLFLLKQG